jgi:basic amino acid/polyamine antiporter, APA family
VARWNAKKTVVETADLAPEHRLKRSLSWPHLVALGVGAIIGAGILTLTGEGAAKAGPAVILAFVIAGVISAAAALAYAEMATMIPASGSAYTYTYVVLGELLAWFIGWSLILEYSLVVSAVAAGWSGHAAPPLMEAWKSFPQMLTHAPVFEGSWYPFTLHVSQSGFNLPAVFIIFVVAGLLIAGTRESATLNAILVAVKVVALVVFVAVALPYFDAANLHPFMPYGFSSSGPSGGEVGVMAAAAVIFFAFYGFDAIATASEEAKRPERDLAIGIVGSMLVCVVIYILVGAAAVGAMSYQLIAHSTEPLALVLRHLEWDWAARYLELSAVIALPTVILAFFYGQSRIFFVMARDGLLPASLAQVSKRGSPVRITLFTTVIVGTIAGLVPLSQIVTLANAGTLTAFIAVAVCMLILRVRDPGAVRKFRTPLPWLVGGVAIIGCAYLFYSLPYFTKVWFLIWNVAGLILYFLYGSRRSVAGRKAA